MSEVKVCAVIVTYNRIVLLQECISALRNQTKPLHCIVVIDNGSSDGTDKWLAEQNDLFVVRQTNLGGAGGFYRGIKEAVNKQCDWVWLMDDDVEPNLDCLYEMLNASDASEIEYSVLQPDRFYIEDKKNGWGYGSKINANNPFKNWALAPVRGVDFPDKRIIEIAGFPFEGPMFKSEVLEKVGDVEHKYFIINDDADYSMRVIQAGYKIGFVPKAVMSKKLGYKKIGLRIDFKLYYLIRNSIIFEKKFFPVHVAYIRNILKSLKVMALFLKQGIKEKNIKLIFNAWGVVFNAFVDGVKFK